MRTMPLVLTLLVLATPLAVAQDPTGLTRVGPQMPGVAFEDSFDTAAGLSQERWSSWAGASTHARCEAFGAGALVIRPGSSYYSTNHAQTQPLQIGEGAVLSFWTRMGQTDLGGWEHSLTVNPECGQRYSYGYQANVDVSVVVSNGACYYYYYCDAQTIWRGNLGELLQWDYFEIPIPDRFSAPGLVVNFRYGGYDYYGTSPAWVIDNVRIQTAVPATGAFAGGAAVPMVAHDPSGTRVYDAREDVLEGKLPNVWWSEVTPGVPGEPYVAGQQEGRAFVYVGNPMSYTSGVNPTGGIYLTCDGRPGAEIPGLMGDEAAVFCDRNGNGQLDEHEEGYSSDYDEAVRFSDHFDGSDLGSAGTCNSVDGTRWVAVFGGVNGCRMVLHNNILGGVYGATYGETQPIIVDGVVNLRFHGQVGTYDPRWSHFPNVPIGVYYRQGGGAWELLAAFEVASGANYVFDMDVPERLDASNVQFRIENGHGYCYHYQRWDGRWEYQCTNGWAYVDDVIVTERNRFSEALEHSAEVNGVTVAEITRNPLDTWWAGDLADAYDLGHVAVYRDRNGDGQVQPDEVVVDTDVNRVPTDPGVEVPQDPTTLVPPVYAPGATTTMDGDSTYVWVDFDADGTYETQVARIRHGSWLFQGVTAGGIEVYNSDTCGQGSTLQGFPWVSGEVVGILSYDQCSPSSPSVPMVCGWLGLVTEPGTLIGLCYDHDGDWVSDETIFAIPCSGAC